MTFDDIGDGESVFIDANTFVYHFTPHPRFGGACRTLLSRTLKQRIAGFTAADVVSDAAHRLMTMEACAVLGWPATGIARRMKRQPTEISRLTSFQTAINEIPLFGVQILPITGQLVLAAAATSRQYGLLSGDALIVAVMQARGLVNLASHDADFDRVQGLIRFAPT
jgi:predicted nucleic acid-binding protein